MYHRLSHLTEESRLSRKRRHGNMSRVMEQSASGMDGAIFLLDLTRPITIKAVSTMER